MIRYLRSADVDIEQIMLECATRSGATRAFNFIEQMRATIRKTLGVFPEGGRLRPEFGIDVRSYPIVPYVVFYRVRKGDIEVLRVIHGHRDINRELLSLLAS